MEKLQVVEQQYQGWIDLVVEDAAVARDATRILAYTLSIITALWFPEMSA